MRSMLTVLLVGSTLVAGAAFAHARLPASLLAAAVIASGVLLSLVASSSAGPLAVASGAAGALSAALLTPHAPALAGALLVAFSFLARAARASTPRRRALHVGLSLAGGLMGSLIAVTFVGSTLAAQIAAAVVSGILGSLALLVPVEDPLAFELGLAADELSDAPRVTLARAAFLAQSAADQRATLARDASCRLDSSLRAVLALGRARASARGAAAGVLDQQLSAHVAEIERLLSASAEAEARAAASADAALLAVRAGGEDLEAQATALAELDTVLRQGAERER